MTVSKIHYFKMYSVLFLFPILLKIFNSTPFFKSLLAVADDNGNVWRLGVRAVFRETKIRNYLSNRCYGGENKAWSLHAVIGCAPHPAFVRVCL